MKKFKYLVVLFVCTLFCACESESFYDTVFIGDAYVARWNLKECFSDTWNCSNKGLICTGIDHIHDCKDMFSKKTVVVYTGLYDLLYMDNNADIDTYVNNYVKYVSEIGKNNDIYVFSIQPCNSAPMDEAAVKKNIMIKSVNEKLKKSVESKGWHYLDAYDKFLDYDGTLKDDLTTDKANNYNSIAYSILSELLQKAIQ